MITNKQTNTSVFDAPQVQEYLFSSIEYFFTVHELYSFLWRFKFWISVLVSVLFKAGFSEETE